MTSNRNLATVTISHNFGNSKLSRLMNIIIKASIISLATFCTLSFGNPVSGDLVVNVGNIKKDKGIIWIGLYDKKEDLFIKEKSILRSIKVDKTGKARITIDNVNFGTYAMAIFHDENNNGKLDKNMFGIPKEPYAFANWPKSKWRAPFYEELIFDFSESNQVINTDLTTWWDM